MLFSRNRIKKFFASKLDFHGITIIGIILIAVIIRIVWMIYTNHTFEDAFITFQYARRLSEGNGLVYNIGEKIYGTTTPLFTLILSGWILIFGDEHIVLGARVITNLASFLSFIFLYKTFQQLKFSHIHQYLILALLAFWPKFWKIDTGGMETSIVIMLMSASWFTSVKRKFTWTGVLLGLLLWLRVDTVLWVIILALSEFKSNFKFWQQKLTTTPILCFIIIFVFIQI